MKSDTRRQLAIFRAAVLDDIEEAHFDVLRRKLEKNQFDTSARKEFRSALEQAWYCGLDAGAEVRQSVSEAEAK